MATLRRLIDLRKGHPKPSNLQHARMAEACRQAAVRLDAGSEAEFPLQYTVGARGTPRFLERLAKFLESGYASRCLSFVLSPR